MAMDVLPKTTKLRDFLDARGIRQNWVAEKVGITQSHLNHITTGRRPMSRSLAERLGVLFNVPAETFLETPNG